MPGWRKKNKGKTSGPGDFFNFLLPEGFVRDVKAQLPRETIVKNLGDYLRTSPDAVLDPEFLDAMYEIYLKAYSKAKA